jgi:hypothetical protein
MDEGGHWQRLTQGKEPNGLRIPDPAPAVQMDSGRHRRTTRMNGHDLFAWFDGLGFPDFSAHRYVRVATGRWFRHGNDPPQNHHVPALLLGDVGGQFRALTLDLREQCWTPTPPGTPQYQLVAYETADLGADVAAHLAAVEAADTHPLGAAARYFGAALGLAADGFILARLCSARGLSEASSTWGTMSGVEYRHGLTDDAWTEFAAALAEGLAAPPDVAVSIRVRATTEQGWAAITED